MTERYIIITIYKRAEDPKGMDERIQQTSCKESTLDATWEVFKDDWDTKVKNGFCLYYKLAVYKLRDDGADGFHPFLELQREHINKGLSKMIRCLNPRDDEEENYTTEF